MEDKELATFIQLKFYPPVPTDEYVDLVPTDVQQRIFNGSNLKEKNIEVREGFKLLIKVYCTGDFNAINFLREFWNVLKDELIEHYSEKDCSV